MAAYSGIPRWAQTSKQKVQRTEQWMSFSKELFDIVSKPMRENGVRTFSALSQEEQKQLIFDAVETMKSREVYTDLLEVVSSTLDKEVSAAADLAVEKKQHSVTKLDFITKECEGAIEAILNKCPETKVHLRQCLGVFLTSKLRYVMWKTQLRNDKSKQDYLNAVASGDKRKLTSSLDFEISQKSQSLLKSDSTLAPLLSIKAAPSLMRHLLSYHHCGSDDATGPTDTEYLLAVPFVYCTLSAVFNKDANADPKKQVLNTEALAVLASQYDVFLSKRAEYMILPQGGRSLSRVSAEIKFILTKVDAVLVNKLELIFARQVKSGTNTKARHFTEIAFPWLRTLLVGYLPLDTAMFVWDQIIVGYDVENFDPVPSFCAALILLARESLVECTNWKEVDAKLISAMKTVSRDDIRGAMVQYNLNARLSSVLEKAHSEKRLYPTTHTATLNSLPPWRDWHSAKLRKYLGSTQQQKSQQAELFPVVEGDEDAASLASEQGETVNDLRNEREGLVEELHLMRGELAEARRLLSEERLAKAELQDDADEQIERLRRQIELIRRRGPPMATFSAKELDLTDPQYTDSEASSVVSVPLPTPPQAPKPIKSATPDQQSLPPSRSPSQVVSPNEDKMVTDEDAPTEEDDALEVLRVIVGKIIIGAKSLAHGTGEEREQVNQKSAADMRQIRRAFDQAKTDVFGKAITDEELMQLPDKDRHTLVLNEATKKRLQRLKFV